MLTMNEIIKADLFRQGGLSGFEGFIKGLSYPGFRYVFYLRMTSRYKKNSILGIFFSLKSLFC